MWKQDVDFRKEIVTKLEIYKIYIYMTYPRMTLKYILIDNRIQYE